MVILAGNPNVGKSTIFNYLTGLRQHTGNWVGKTVANAVGVCKKGSEFFRIADIPGIYSLHSHTPEERLARDFIACEPHRAVVIVCDSTCLWRGLVLAISISELTPHIVLCLHLSDQAKKKGITIDEKALSAMWNIPVVTTSSKDKRSLKQLANLLERPIPKHNIRVTYSSEIEDELTLLESFIAPRNPTHLPDRYLAIKCLENDQEFIKTMHHCYGWDHSQLPTVSCLQSLAIQGYDSQKIERELLNHKQRMAEAVCQQVIRGNTKAETPVKADRFLTGRFTAVPTMFIGLLLLFWITMIGAQIPSQILWDGLFWLETPLVQFLSALSCPTVVTEVLVFGIYRVVAWVVSVMLPPMAIFFPLFTILEDIGILPRIAFNLDHLFQTCRTCGKQAITMCMGFGCNAAGVTGCRVIRSERERQIAIITNALVPCNGRFPTLITMLTLFFTFSATGLAATWITALELTAVILLGVGATFLCSRLLSKTLFKGYPSFYSLELPAYRMPKIGQVLVRSMLDRTVFVLLRSLAVAAPAGLLLWLLANIPLHQTNLLQYCAASLDPIGRLIGLDGAILLAFILGSPANEIVVPITLMIYNASGILTDYSSLASLKQLLLANGWTTSTALCMILFMLFHWPCATTMITVYKETKRWSSTLLAFILPTTLGCLLCAAVHWLFVLMS